MSDYVPKPDIEGINSPKSENQFLDAMILLAGFFGILAVVSVSFIFIADAVMSRVSLEREIQWFGDIELTDEKKKSPWLERIVEKINARADFPMQVSILCSKEPNAFAFLGGKIFVTSGLLSELKSENGLAFVLAHEMGHVVHRDNVRNLGRKAVFQALSVLLGLGDAGNLATFSGFISLGYDRNLEESADEYALQLVSKVYGHTNGADEFFQRMSEDESILEKNLARFASTHPPSADRLAKLKAAQSGAGDVIPLPDHGSSGVCSVW